jgi:hypothetical protein
MTLPITGTLNYLSNTTQHIKLQVSVDTGGQQITRDSWVINTPTVIPPVLTEWAIVSTDPTTCRKEVLSRASYPQCKPWDNPATNQWTLECTVTVQGNKATLDFSEALSGNLVTKITEKITIGGMTDTLTITVDSQASSAPDLSTFDRPSICSAPNGNNQGENDNSQGNEVGTIPLQLLLWLL